MSMMNNVKLEKNYVLPTYEDLDYLKACKDSFKEELLNEILKHVKLIEGYSENGDYVIKCDFDVIE